MKKISLTLSVIIFTITPIYAQSHFGIGGGLPPFPNELQESGAELVRQWINWNEIEPVNDDYNWDAMDEVVRLANNAGIEVLGYFINMPSWARNKDNPKCARTIKDMLIDACEPRDWNDFKEFAKNVAERYDGNHGHGEMKYIAIFNEVQGFSEMNSTEYGHWLINGYQAIKQGNPNAQVLLGAVHAPLDFPSEDFIDTMLEQYSDYYDIFNFHIYQYKDSCVGETIEYIKNRMNYYGVDKPMWITETATFIATVKCGDNLNWYNTIAKGIIKRYAQALGNDVEKVFWYCFVGLPTIEEDPRGIACGQPTNFSKGSLGWDIKPDYTFHPRPAYYTYKLMTSKLAGFSLVEKITNTQYKFTVSNKNIYVLWCNTDKCSLPSEINGMVKVTDYLGNEETKQASEIILTESPVFIEDSLSTSIEDKSSNLNYPNKFYLLQNYPNPFNPTTTIKYNLSKSNNLSLKIYNLSGQIVEILINEFQTQGDYKIVWQPKGLPNGIYFYRLQAGNFSETKKLILQK